MFTINNILNRFTESDVLLIQPSTLMKNNNIDKIVEDYFESVKFCGGLPGDNPVEPNYGLLVLATNLSKIDITVEILDFNYIDYILRAEGKQLNSAIIEKILLNCSAKMYGISYMASAFGMWEDALYKIIRSLPSNSDKPIVYGGIHPSIYWSDIIKSKNDKNFYVMLGEGDVEFPLFCEILLKNKRHNLHGIAGFSNNPHKQLITANKLIEMPQPNYSLLPEYHINNDRRYYLTRGCTSRCSFCSVSSFHSKLKDVYYRQLCKDTKGSNLHFPQIDQIIKDHEDGNNIIIGDLTFFETAWYYKEFSQQLINKMNSTGVPLKWWCQTRADTINQDMVRILKDSGCHQIAIGCESANNEILHGMKKHITANEWKTSLEIIKEGGIKTQAYIIIGNGFDNYKSVEETIKTVEGLVVNGLIDIVHLSIIAPYPGTLLYDDPKKHGIEINSYDYANYWMNCDKYGYGLPVYNTISPEGKLLMTSDDIYKYWKMALITISSAYNSKI